MTEISEFLAVKWNLNAAPVSDESESVDFLVKISMFVETKKCTINAL